MREVLQAREVFNGCVQVEAVTIDGRPAVATDLCAVVDAASELHPRSHIRRRHADRSSSPSNSKGIRRSPSRGGSADKKQLRESSAGAAAEECVGQVVCFEVAAVPMLRSTRIQDMPEAAFEYVVRVMADPAAQESWKVRLCCRMQWFHAAQETPTCESVCHASSRQCLPQALGPRSQTSGHTEQSMWQSMVLHQSTIDCGSVQQVMALPQAQPQRQEYHTRACLAGPMATWDTTESPTSPPWRSPYHQHSTEAAAGRAAPEGSRRMWRSSGYIRLLGQGDTPGEVGCRLVALTVGCLCSCR